MRTHFALPAALLAVAAALAALLPASGTYWP
jgi:hypothetical protein